jgi:pyridoxine/pyridoxamine 5'-phosphate oxidase
MTSCRLQVTASEWQVRFRTDTLPACDKFAGYKLQVAGCEFASLGARFRHVRERYTEDFHATCDRPH